MKRWIVKIRGEGFLISFDDGVWPAGFYTTRYVEAELSDLAENAAIALIRDDPDLISVTTNSPEDSPMLYAELIREVQSFDGVTPPGKGYTFFRVKP